MSEAHDKPNSRRYMLTQQMADYVTEILRRWGRDFDHCEQCAKPINGRHTLHHTRYAGATIHDIQIVCRSCNGLTANRGLA